MDTKVVICCSLLSAHPWESYSDRMVWNLFKFLLVCPTKNCLPKIICTLCQGQPAIGINACSIDSEACLCRHKESQKTDKEAIFMFFLFCFVFNSANRICVLCVGVFLSPFKNAYKQFWCVVQINSPSSLREVADCHILMWNSKEDGGAGRGGEASNANTFTLSAAKLCLMEISYTAGSLGIKGSQVAFWRHLKEHWNATICDFWL